jgi:hypothetical protein
MLPLLPISLGNYSTGTSTTGYNNTKVVFDAMNCGASTSQGAVGCLAGHLLAAKLNVKNGADSSCIAATIAAADAFLKGQTLNGVPGINYTGPGGTYTLTTAQRAYAISLKNALDSYNNHVGCV